LESVFEDALSVMAGDVFCAKVHRSGGTSSAAALAVGGLDGSLPQFFCQKLGIPSAPSDCTLALSTLLAAESLARKRFSRPMKLKRASNKKGKESNSQT